MRKSRCNPDKILTDWWMKYYERQYEIDNLLLIPTRRKSMKEMRSELDEYISVMELDIPNWQKEKYGAHDYSFKIIYGRHSCDIDTINKERTIECSDGKRRHFNPNSTYDMGQVSNIVMIDAYGEYDLNGEIVKDYELEMLKEEFPNIFNEFYRGEQAIRVKDKKCVVIGSDEA